MADRIKNDKDRKAYLDTFKGIVARTPVVYNSPSPSSRENEAGLIGAILKNSAALESIADIICPEDFYWQCYGWAWEATLSLKSRGLSVDAITVGDELERTNNLEKFQTHDRQLPTGRNALSYLRDEGDPRSVLTYAHNVKDYSSKRQLDQLFKTGVYWAENGRNAEEIMQDIARKMSEIKTFDGGAFEHTKTIAEAVSDAYDYTDKANQGLIQYVSTGFVDLDDILSGGMTAPDFLIIAGRPGSGKTAWLSCVALNAAKNGKRVGIFTLEMENKQIAMRLIAQESGVSYDKQKKPSKFEDKDWPKYTNGVEKIASLPIFLNDLPAISVSKVRQEIRHMGKIDLLILDYIQLGGVDGKYDRRDQEIGEITRGLKSIAKEFQVPVLAAAQMSREVERRADKRPVLSDLRESGSLEQDSDIVMFIHRPDQYEKKDSNQNVTEIIVEKHRNGPVGSVELIFRNTLTKFESAVRKELRIE